MHVNAIVARILTIIARTPRNGLSTTHPSLPTSNGSCHRLPPVSTLRCWRSTTLNTVAGKPYISSALQLSPQTLYWQLHCTCKIILLRIRDKISTRMLTDLVRYVKTSPTTVQKTSHAVALSILLSPALLIIDHIHFQYNGFLYGILILSLVFARKQSTMVLSGLLFASLLCFKHVYLYLAPAYFIYLLRAHCLSPKSIFRIRFGNCIILGCGVLAVFGVAFGPFWFWGQIDQLFSRLFPFSRGLCHAYWAPNIWSMYSFIDRVLIYGNSSFHNG